LRSALRSPGALRRLAILPARAHRKRQQAICALQRRFFHFHAACVAIPFRGLPPKIDDLLLQRRGQLTRGRLRRARLIGGPRFTCKPHANPASFFFYDGERELRVAATAGSAAHHVDAALAGRHEGEPSVVEPDDAAKAAAMQHTAALMFHGLTSGERGPARVVFRRRSRAVLSARAVRG